MSCEPNYTANISRYDTNFKSVTPGKIHGQNRPGQHGTPGAKNPVRLLANKLLMFL